MEEAQEITASIIVVTVKRQFPHQEIVRRIGANDGKSFLQTVTIFFCQLCRKLRHNHFAITHEKRPLKLLGFQGPCGCSDLLPLNRAGGFGGEVVKYAADARDFGGYAV